jgi:hypothetical protein
MNNFASPLLQLEPHSDPVAQITFDRREEICVTASKNGLLKLWDLENSKESQQCWSKHNSAVTCLEFHPFAEFFCTATQGGEVFIWDTRHKQAMQDFKHGAPVSCVEFSPDGKWVVSGDQSGTIAVWDLIAGKEIRRFSAAPSDSASVSCISFHSHDLLMFCVNSDSIVSSYDLNSWEEKQVALETKNPLFIEMDIVPEAGWILHENGLNRFSWHGSQNSTGKHADGFVKDVKDAMSLNEILYVARCVDDSVTISKYDLKLLKQSLESKRHGEDATSENVNNFRDNKEPGEDKYGDRNLEVEVTEQDENRGPDSLNKVSQKTEEDEIISACLYDHFKINQKLSENLLQLKSIKTLWNSGVDIQVILETVHNRNLVATFRDILPLLKKSSKDWISIDTCLFVIPLIADCLKMYPSRNKDSAELATKFLSSFSDVIIDLIKQEKAMSVDVSHEDLLRKCKQAVKAFQKLDDTLNNIVKKGGFDRKNTDLYKCKSAVTALLINL